MLNDEKLLSLLDGLHEKSKGEEPAIFDYFGSRFRDGQPIVPIDLGAGADREFFADKFAALDRDKAAFCYGVCRALKARRIVEAGTSFGVSTLWLAAALRDNGHKAGDAKVIATEYEPTKAKIARENFARAGLEGYIELREGDLRETLNALEGPIDFALIDIWIPMAAPALARVAPHLREGAIVICDNTADFREQYQDYFDFLNDPANRFRSMTLPFSGGLEFSVRCA